MRLTIGILDEFGCISGYHRKHAIRLLNGTTGRDDAPRPRSRDRVYDKAIRQALIVLWEASDRACGKRLKPPVPMLVCALERHGHMRLDGTIRTKLLAASAATMDRLLQEARHAAGLKKVASEPSRRTSGRALGAGGFTKCRGELVDRLVTDHAINACPSTPHRSFCFARCVWRFRARVPAAAFHRAPPSPVQSARGA
jgi:hypothetical protein